MSDPTRGTGAAAVLHRIVRAARKTMARQQYLHERYLAGMGTSGQEARASLVAIPAEVRDLERLFGAPAISGRDRQPRPPNDA